MKVEVWKHVPSGCIFETEEKFNEYVIKWDKAKEQERKDAIKKMEIKRALSHINELIDKEKQNVKAYQAALKEHISVKTKDVVEQINDYDSQYLKAKQALDILKKALRNMEKEYTTEYQKEHPDPSKNLVALNNDYKRARYGYIPTKYKKIAKGLCGSGENPQTPKKRGRPAKNSILSN